MSLRFKPLLALCALLLVSTAHAGQVSLASPVAEELPVYVVINQRELIAPVSNTAGAVGMQFGILGALVGAAVQDAQTKNAEAAVAPLRNALLDYNFPAKVEATLRARLPSEGISLKPQFHFVDGSQDSASLPFALPARFLSISPILSVDAKFSRLFVQMNVAIKDGEVKPNGKTKFRMPASRLYSFEYRLKNFSEFNPQTWAKLGSTQLSAMLDEAINQTVEMMVYDFSVDGRKQWTLKHKKEVTVVQNIPFQGRQLHHGDHWAWVRNGPGAAIQIIQGFYPLTSDMASKLTFPLSTQALAVASASAPASAQTTDSAEATTNPAPVAAPAPATEAAAAP